MYWIIRTFPVHACLVVVILFFVTGCGVSATTTLTAGQTPIEFTQNIVHMSLPSGEATQTSSCPTGTALVSGGYAVDAPVSYGLFSVLDSYPSLADGSQVPSGQAANSWTIHALNKGTTTFDVTVSANCVKGTGVQTITWNVEHNLDPANPDDATGQTMDLNCQNTQYPTITGGGYTQRPSNPSLGNLGSFVTETYPTAVQDLSTQTWHLHAVLGIVREFVICTQGLFLHQMSVTPISTKTDPLQQNQVNGTLQCPAATILVGGGYTVRDPHNNFPAVAPTFANTTNATGVPDFTVWHVGGKYTMPYDETQNIQLTGIAMCDADQRLYH